MKELTKMMADYNTLDNSIGMLTNLIDDLTDKDNIYDLRITRPKKIMGSILIYRLTDSQSEMLAIYSKEMINKLTSKREKLDELLSSNLEDASMLLKEAKEILEITDTF